MSFADLKTDMNSPPIERTFDLNSKLKKQEHQAYSRGRYSVQLHVLLSIFLDETARLE